MRVDRSLKFLTILATITACGAPAATPDAAPPPAAAAPAPVAAAPVAEPAPVPEPAPQSGISVRWDSRPLDIEYRRERESLDSRWKVEITTGRPGESRAERERRREAEQRALEARYERGKREHMRRLPPG